MIVLIDNHDSFVHNLGRYVVCRGQPVRVVRSDTITIPELMRIQPYALILSPGPCAPDQAGITLDAIAAFCRKIPILGVCLGHQAIGQFFGGQVVHAPTPMHGMASEITHDGTGLFANLPERISVGRYHSLMVQLSSIGNKNLNVTARDEQGVIMGLSHKILPCHGVQFHPESILTPQGGQMIDNFLNIVAQWWQMPQSVRDQIAAMPLANEGAEHEVAA